jgi:hypothetical protein
MPAAIPDPPTRRADVEMEVMPDGSGLLYDPQADKGHVLTALGALVWDMCDGTLTAAAIADECAALLPQQPDTADIVRDLIGSFVDLHLLMEGPERA